MKKLIGLVSVFLLVTSFTVKSFANENLSDDLAQQSADVKKFGKDLVSAVANNDFQFVMNALDETTVWCVGGGFYYPWFGCYKGRDNIVAMFTTIHPHAVSTTSINLEDIGVSQDTAYARVSQTGIFANSKEVSIDTMWVMKVKRGSSGLKLDRMDFFFHNAEMPQVGF